MSWWWHPKPKPPTPPPLEVHLSVWGTDGLIPARQIAEATLTPEPTGVVLQFGPLLGENRLRTVLPPGTPYTWGAQLHLVVPGYLPCDVRVFLAPDLDQGLTPSAPSVVVLERLVIDGQFFRLASGTRFTAIECSDFLLYQRWLNGEDLTVVRTQRRDLGFNMVRMFGMYNGSLGRFIPAEYDERYFTELPAFFGWLAQGGLYGEFTAFADATTAMPDVPHQLVHWNTLIAALVPIQNVLLEVGNELDQPINRLDSLSQLARPVVTSSRGSYGSQVWPPQPFWDYIDLHTNGAPEEQRKVGHNAMEIWTGPTLTSETSRYPDVGMWAGFDLGRQTHLAYDSAAGAALLCAGSCFHSVEGKSSNLFAPNTAAVARSWVAGAKSVSLMCQPGAYSHRTDLEGPDILRAYQRGLSDSCIVRIRR